ncbi:MAG: citrate/2-methylcitrate synthase [Conexivisphaera sp.]
MPTKPTPEMQKWCLDEKGQPKIDKGAENLCMDESEICFIDGFHSKLYYRGYSIEDLANYSNYEETTYLLWYGKLPTKSELDAFSNDLRNNRDIPQGAYDLIKSIPRDTHPMEALRTVVSYLGNVDPEKGKLGLDSMPAKAVRLTAKLPTVVAALARARDGKEPIKPRKDLSHAANFLYMLSGNVPGEFWARAMDVSLVLYAEHEMNASTFATTVVGSTLSDYYSSIVGGIGALRGPLHGGANEEAMKQFLEIGSPDNVDAWYKEYALTGKKRVMGAGHRVYKTYDPRAKIFREYSKKAVEVSGDPKLKGIHEIAERLENLVMSQLCESRGICTNVDYWSGIVYYAMGIPIEQYTPIFAVARIAGWSAHLMEYVARNRILRPRLYYKGMLDLEYVPIEKRG